MMASFTDSAAQKVADLIRGEENAALMLRAYVTGGGCSGFQYGFTFDETMQEGDTVIKKDVPDPMKTGIDHVKLCIDLMSINYLLKAEIDYKEDLEGARFIIRNPDAVTTCGCGSSFGV